jgi:AmmeMemoRadiSam system protein B
MAGRGRQVCLIASADLSHVGPRFGGSRALTPAYLEKVEQHDRAVLRAAMEGRADEMLSAVLRRHNDTNICGLTSMYVMLNALGECQGELLDYRQATSPDRQQCVTFAAATFRG